MTTTDTLTSLAMLKVRVDQGQDYLDYLRPFVLQVLVDDKPDPVTNQVVQDLIRTQFGLEIPERTIEVVIRRISRNLPLNREMGVYRIVGSLPNPMIAEEKSKAQRHIEAVVSGLTDFSKKTVMPISDREDSVTAICAFLTEFNIQCLRAYLRGTTIPTLEGEHESKIVLVSEYVLHLQQNDPERFESFLIMLQGHMLANALLCPDLRFATNSYKGVSFYLDTPLLIRRIGLEGDPVRQGIENLILLLRNLGAKVRAFSHSREELEGVINGAARFVDDPKGRGAIIQEARRNGTTKSDFMVLAGQIDDKLNGAEIEVMKTPEHIAHFQIDETAFDKILGDEVSYFNPRAKEFDINSVRSIYVLRAKKSPSSIEQSKAILATSNAGFARAAYEYGKQHQETREVSSVITDFSLANMAWRKAPLGAPNLPITEVISFSYAALKPSTILLSKFLSEMEKLEKQGKITPRDHQLLRSNYLAEDELMRLTLGDEDALTEETITETLRRVTREITKDADERLKNEKTAHLQTQRELDEGRSAKQKVQERIFWRCRRKSNRLAWIVSIVIAILLVSGFAAGIGLWSSNPILGLLMLIGAGVLILLSAMNLFLGTNVIRMHQWVQDHFLTWFLRQEEAAIGIDAEITSVSLHEKEESS